MFDFVEYCDMYLILGQCRGNYTMASRVYGETYPQRVRPAKNVFQRLDRRMRETGQLPCNIACRDNGRPHTSRTPENEEAIIDYIDENPSRGCRGVAGTLGLSKSLVQWVLASEKSLHIITLGCRPYKKVILTRGHTIITGYNNWKHILIFRDKSFGRINPLRVIEFLTRKIMIIGQHKTHI
jgi:hypothetical protein